MIIVLHGAKRNVGDFLIRDRAMALLGQLLPHQEFDLRPRWERLDPDLVEQASAIVIAGGPGLASHFHPGVVPLTGPTLPTVPILPLAVGWSGRPKGHPEDFVFDADSRRALRTILGSVGWGSVRDDLTYGVVERADVGTVEMTGCVAWYDLDSLGTPVEAPRDIKQVVVTTPASLSLIPQCIRLLHGIRDRFPTADRVCAFHRGIGRDVHTTTASVAGHRVLATAARRLGYRIVDASFDTDKIRFYRTADLHVGYRVHAHLAFLSAHRPSLLLSEDGRGDGQAATLHPQVRLGVASGAIHDALRVVDRELDDDFPLLRGAVAKIEQTAPLMRETIRQLA